MATTDCAVCGASFSARCDAVYCSGACRQKAHRARVARRVDALRDRLQRDLGSQPTRRAAATSLQRAVAVSVWRAHQRVERSRELCRSSEERLLRCAAARQQPDSRYRAAPAAGEASPWRGS